MKQKKLKALLAGMTALCLYAGNFQTIGQVQPEMKSVLVNAENDVATSGMCGNNVSWRYDFSTDTVIISGTGEMWEFEDYGENTSPWGIYSSNFVIEDGVTTIGSYAFRGHSKLKSFIIPDSVTYIGEHAFSYCSSLESITIPNSVTRFEESAFYGCSSLKSIIIKNPECDIYYGFGYKIPDTATIYGYADSKAQAYAEENNINFKLIDEEKAPEETTTSSTTQTTTTTSTTSTTQTTSTATSDKCGNNLTWNFDSSTGTLKIQGKGQMWDFLATVFEHGEAPWCSNKNICNSMKAVIIEDGVTNIGGLAFLNCYSLESVTIPNSVIQIGYKAFESCRGLKSVTIPDSVKVINGFAFSSCCFESVTIPASVTEIGDGAFRSFYLKSIIIENPECKIFSSSSTIPDTATIYGYADSTAQAYAEEYDINFVALDEIPEETTTSSTTQTTTTTSTTSTTQTTSTTSTTQTTSTTSTTQTTSTTSTTQTTSTTTTSESTETTITTTTTEIVPTETTVANIASDEELCNWAVNDYKSKNNIKNTIKASISGSGNEQREILLIDEENKKVIDIYTINPVTGIGANAQNTEINLPQTGNNSMKNLLISISALLATGFGYLAMKKSGIRRKED